MRAGFCLMGACQDCWVWLADGPRVRACTTPVAEGMHVLTHAPPEFPRHEGRDRRRRSGRHRGRGCACRARRRAGRDRRRRTGRADRSIGSRGRACGSTSTALLGAEAENYRRTHAAFDASARPHRLPAADARLGASTDRTLHTIRGAMPPTVDFDALILATGATDRMLPIPGWTLPGVFTLGGAQVLLKEHGCLIGRRVVFCGSFAAALSRSQAISRNGRRDRRGARHDAVRRQDRGRSRICWLRRGTFARGLGYMAALRRAGVADASRRRASRLRGHGRRRSGPLSRSRRERDHARLRCRRVRLRPQA